ncbi:dihydrolipoamide acetyltransferase family protein [Paenibacillus alvei]|uniref:dihydrolipoamide acetyltransferase family protein n=1 Tax=Paenibacillus alvei TaxID=44250 RepID=UPI0018CD24BE|nr:dihydrolipoamide acetyltransferase family protein [Paenibacillus alvei]MBG9737372.1 2-oxoglutarate dehydrogenase [Paenibacillus alvei]MBG9746085.1 2-oxoglutarate dehydrogenase [Paenibacillus alvei]MCY9579091.1 2-oxo acid dehydrogenase subunit E2 [Paenibacillus alvei]MCY9583518.1 2-oxo acid dehydrogenase subunit E2 [Paenibacillus alvei]
MIEFKLPDVGEGIHEGEIGKWLIKEGEWVACDQPIVEVQTDKVNAELTAPTAGVVRKLMFAEGAGVRVGEVLFILEAEGRIPAMEAGKAEQAASVAAVVNAPSPSPAAALPLSVAASPPASAGLPAGRVRAAPYVRQLARQLNVDIEQVKGSGAAGRITEEDVRHYASADTTKEAEGADLPRINTAVPPAREKSESVVRPRGAAPDSDCIEERLPLRGIRLKIAERLVKAVTTIPHVTQVDELEADALQALRERLRPLAVERQVKLTYLPFFIKAIVIALKEFPFFNASLDDETKEIVLKRYYHIGIATDTPDGLIVPVIRDADRKTVFELAEEIGQLSERAREGKLKLEEITGGTFTISNVGPIGSLLATPIINHPEAAILALHKMEPRMVVRNGEGVIRLMMNMALSFDHRLIDGAEAIRFTNRIKRLLEQPDLLWAEMV